jgi:hypothetical protein
MFDEERESKEENKGFGTIKWLHHFNMEQYQFLLVISSEVQL